MLQNLSYNEAGRSTEWTHNHVLKENFEMGKKKTRNFIIFFFSLFIPAVFKVHLSVILMYINSQNTAVYSGISYQ